MGKISILHPEQKTILRLLGKESALTNAYYFTGGTALSEVYLQHRESQDLDLFSKQPVDQKEITAIMTSLCASKQLTLDVQTVGPVLMCFLTYPTGYRLKIDFAHYPYPSIESSHKTVSNFTVDSLRDIATNKLLSITQRTEVKDFVDLYFLLQTYTFWDLRTAVEEKFHMDIDPLYVSSDYLKVEDFSFLPHMYKKFSLDELKDFFRGEAVKLSSGSIA